MKKLKIKRWLFRDRETKKERVKERKREEERDGRDKEIEN